MTPWPRLSRGRDARRSSPQIDSSCSNPSVAWARDRQRDARSPLGHDRNELSRAVTTEDVVREALRLATPRERDDAAAEAASDHAGSERTGRTGELHEPVEFGGRDLVVVPKRTVRCAQDVAELRIVVLAQRPNRFAHSRVLGHDVPDTSIEGRGEPVEELVQGALLDLAQRPDSQVAAGFLA